MSTKKKPQRGPDRSSGRQPFGGTQSDPFSGLTMGDEVPSFTRGPIDRVRIARYAGAIDEYSVMHLDDAGARAGGMPQVYVQPMLAGAWCAQMLTDWLQGGRVVKIDLRFVKMVWPGDIIVSHGRVSHLRREAERGRVEVDVWAENQRGELVIRGAALCELKPGAVLLRPPPPVLPRKAPPAPLPLAQPAKKAAAPHKTKPAVKKPAAAKKLKKHSAKKPATKAKPKKSKPKTKPKTRTATKAKPVRIAAKRSHKKGAKK